MKAPVPTNSLGVYLTNKRLQNRQISEKTGIPESDLSKMRSGEIESISAERLYLIKGATKDSISDLLRNVYPDLKLSKTDKPVSKRIKKTTSAVGKVILSLEDNTLDILAYRSGLKRDRLLRLTRLEKDKIDAHELYLIELAAEKEPGTLFNELYGTTSNKR